MGHVHERVLQDKLPNLQSHSYPTGNCLKGMFFPVSALFT